jgi:hypothetical protein
MSDAGKHFFDQLFIGLADYSADATHGRGDYTT